MESPSRKIFLQSRDIEILRGLFECRVMTMGQITSLYFENRPESAKKRIQKLNREGFVTTSQQNGIFVRRLTTAGLKLLRDQGVISEYPPLSRAQLERRLQVSDFTLNHELGCVDVKAAFTRAIRNNPNTEFIEFSTWPLLYEFEGTKGNPVKPDGFLHFRTQIQEDEPRDRFYFLELDRSTESQIVLCRKAMEYSAYYRESKLAVSGERDRQRWKEHPFGVLVVLETTERRNNFAEWLIQRRFQNFNKIWLSTFNEVLDDPLGAIWIRPHEYREAIRGTEFDPENPQARRTYRRKQTRESVVANKIRKISLPGQL